MYDNSDTLMLELQQASLTMDDLREYLDTHLYDKRAIERFNQACLKYEELKKQYSNMYFPLNGTTANNNEAEWAWALSDFPWDY